MPELPEVETVARQLAPLLEGGRVLRLEALDPRLALGDEDARRAGGRTVARVSRAGKLVVLELEARPRRPPLWLTFHLRMTGRLIWSGQAENDERRHLRAVLTLDRGRLLFFDPRRFGLLRIHSDAEEFAAGGLDPLGGEFTDRRLIDLLEGSRQEIKPWLLRQDRLTGLGNIYASEILFHSRIHPRRLAGDLSAAEIRRLRKAVVEVLRRAVERGGTTFSDYRNAEGLAGSFQHELAVYGREGQPCPRCRRPVERFVQQQRSTFYCPHCQK